MARMDLPSAWGKLTLPAIQDERDHKSLIETLISEVVPLYYKRDPRACRASGSPGRRTRSERWLAIQCGPDGDGLRAAAICRPPVACRAACPCEQDRKSRGLLRSPCDGGREPRSSVTPRVPRWP